MTSRNRFEAGYGEVDITPRLGISLGGYGFYLDRRAEAVLDPLKVRALTVRCGATSALFVSADLVGFSLSAAVELRRAVALECGIPASHVLLACTHTHSAPLTQSLPGLGEVDPEYVRQVNLAVVGASRQAFSDIRTCRVKSLFRVVEPIGYNRARGDFGGIDPVLKALVFERDDGRIYLISYACHPVTLGRSCHVSADWPGALVRVLEDGGDRGVFLQGFCGDIDPVVNLEEWATGGPEDLELYGSLLSGRLLRPKRNPVDLELQRVHVEERRIRLPLTVPMREEIEREVEEFLRWNSRFPNADRFIREWKEKALSRREEIAARPFVDNIPLQVIAVGEVAILGVPGEVFCALGIRLRTDNPNLVPVGFANGDVGYFPTTDAYSRSGDYAAYCAPKFYALFPFRSDVSEILMAEARGLLDRLAA